jgi:hypothetical protein
VSLNNRKEVLRFRNFHGWISWDNMHDTRRGVTQ